MAIFDPPGKILLMHGPCGLRIEIIIGDIDTRLELWLSPQAHSSKDWKVRNLANRDDPLRLFEAIVFPQFTESQFTGCAWDPFHSVLHFGSQSLHVLALFNDPGVALWSNKELAVDFKSGRDATTVLRTDAVFAVHHKEAGHELNFAAAARPECMLHQRVPEIFGRARYARALVAAETPVIVIGEDTLESGFNPVDAATKYALRDPQSLCEDTESAIVEGLSAGNLCLRDDSQLSELMEKCRRLLLACQDKQGAIRAAISRIYYMIWVRDGAITTAFQSYSGWRDAVSLWTEFLLANPTVIDDPDCKGRSFGQLVGQIAKRQEDGVFYAVWSAFSTWSQSGSPVCDVEKLSVLTDAVDWLERWCFDSSEGLFYRVFACETPMLGSWDNGYDNAAGWVWKGTSQSSGVFCRGKSIKRTYDSYINLSMISVYRMLAALSGDRSWLLKADQLHANASHLFPLDQPAPYGRALCTDGSEFLAGPYELDREDYAWGHSIPLFGLADPGIRHARRENVLDLLDKRREGYFLASYFSVLTAADPLDHSSEAIYSAIREGAETSFEGGGNYPMPMALLEKLGEGVDSKWHYIRPQCFSAGPFLAALANLGVRRLPFGLSVRSGFHLQHLQGYQWGDCTLNFSFDDHPDKTLRVFVNGHALNHSLQIPESMLETVSSVEVSGRDIPSDQLLLLESSCRLVSIVNNSERIVFELEAFGQTEIVIMNCRNYPWILKSAEGEIASISNRDGGRLLIEAQHFGRFTLSFEV